MLDQIKAKIAARDFSEAENAARTVLNSNPNNGRARGLLGQALIASGRAIEGREELEHANTLVPLTPESALALAECYLGEQRRQLGFEMLIHLSTRRDCDALTLRKAAAAADSCDHPWVAKAICERSLKRFPHEPQTYYELGYYCGRMGSPTLMEGNARKAIDLDPRNVCYRVGLATSLMKQGRTVDAYDLVKGFSAREVAEVCCHSCLQSLLTIFEASNDSLRASLCQSQVSQRKPGDSHGH